MTERPTQGGEMRTLRFHADGEPAEVLQLENAAIPSPGPGQIRVKGQARGLNPADWALCRGLFAGTLPRGIGLDVSGTVDALGAGVTDVRVGDLVLGVPDFEGQPSAGASDFAVPGVWTPVSQGLDLSAAAALPMAIETAPPDLVFDAGPISDVLPVLVRIAGVDAHRIVTVSNHGPAAQGLGVRDSFGPQRYDALAEFAKLAAEGRFKVPVARTFGLEARAHSHICQAATPTASVTDAAVSATSHR